MDLAAAREAVRPHRDVMEAELARLVRIPSVAFPDFPPEPVLDAADATGEILRSVGLPGVRMLELEGGFPAVFGSAPAPAGAPTVLLYAHYDVQPSGPEDLWSTPPFEPSVRERRMYGRGTADDKSGIVLHAATLRAFGGAPPVGVKVLIEGEEEATTEHLPALIEGHRDLLGADVVVVADSGNVRTGTPSLTTTVRGVVDLTVEVRTLELPVHSGAYGGPAPDALLALVRMLGSLHDDPGDVAVPGLLSAPDPPDSWDEAGFREEARILPGLELLGSGSVAARIWSRPSINVIGIDAPTVHGSRNILVDRARARVSVRLAPGEDPVRGSRLVGDHLRAAAPWGAEVSITHGELGAGFDAPTDGPAYAAARRALEDAYGRAVVPIGSGGSVPLIPALAGAFPDAEILMMGASDDVSNTHAQDESVDLDELERAALAQILLLAELAAVR